MLLFLELNLYTLNINLFFLAIGLITQNFRDGKPMDISNTELDEVRYQRRGYGKYFAIAKLLGWNVLSGLNLQENNEQEGKMIGFAPFDHCHLLSFF